MQTRDNIGDPSNQGKPIFNLLFTNTDQNIKDDLNNIMCVNDAMVNIYKLHPKFLEYITICSAVNVIGEDISLERVEEINQSIGLLIQQKDSTKLRLYMDEVLKNFTKSEDEESNISDIKKSEDNNPNLEVQSSNLNVNELNELNFERLPIPE
jgi:hypothetical protein